MFGRSANLSWNFLRTGVPSRAVDCTHHGHGRDDGEWPQIERAPRLLTKDMGLVRRSEIEKNEEIIDKTNFYHLWLDLSPLVAADTVVLKGDLFVDQKKPDGLGKSADIENIKTNWSMLLCSKRLRSVKEKKGKRVLRTGRWERGFYSGAEVLEAPDETNKRAVKEERQGNVDATMLTKLQTKMMTID
ncbi:hypothetical protein GCK72_009252 [Caenorhabditis remanei]|uniref:Uncharacterized protein n=1 Tax=Caenorhabditis remanei TaxID=31234 RepID=A0A6A5H201_CAERE|nr:hypothetical protein GCK72_009252 [Caenorhabditis remanei]KAF1760999.1 hypothetical protein GCK72_009252 [Caenorhabditis remanei]